MPVPKRKRSRARRDSRFANKGMKVKIFAKCNNCQEAVLPHQVCNTCGFYKGIKVLTTKGELSLKLAQSGQFLAAQIQAANPEQE